MVKIKQSIILLLLSSAYAGLASAMTSIDQSTIDAAKARIVEACPVRWEDPSSLLTIPTLASEVIWENEADRTAFINYMTAVLQEMGSTASPTDFADDVNSVAAECATHRTALLDLLLVKEPNDVVVGMRAIMHNLDNMVQSGRDGSIRETAGRDCKTIKAAFPDSSDGTYWIDVTAGNSNDAIEVFCDMTTDGGGWTLVSYISASDYARASSGFHTFFHTALGTYDVNRQNVPQHFSLGILPELDDTEMMVTLNSPDPLLAYNNKRFVRFRYSKTVPMFNFGPLPGTNSFMEQSYDIENPTFKEGSLVYSDGANVTYWAAQGEYYSLMFHGHTTTIKGIAIGSSLITRGTNNAAGVIGGNAAWFYVR